MKYVALGTASNSEVGNIGPETRMISLSQRAQFLIVAAVLAMAAAYQFLWPRPTTYEECVLQAMKGQSEKMIQIATRMCRQKFPSKVVTDPALIEQLNKLSGGKQHQ